MPAVGHEATTPQLVRKPAGGAVDRGGASAVPVHHPEDGALLGHVAPAAAGIDETVTGWEPLPGSEPVGRARPVSGVRDAASPRTHPPNSL